MFVQIYKKAGRFNHFNNRPVKGTILVTVLFLLATKAIAQKNREILPTKAQLEWAGAEIGAMFHLDMQVFEPDYDWRKMRDYQPDVSVFNPKELDTDQWIQAAKSMGATYAVLVAKHCSGFSLWPTSAHPYSVKNTTWRNGQGDIVKDFIASCKKYGLKPGLYASVSANAYFKVDNPGLALSGNTAEQEKYNEMVKAQLTELWTRYGKLFEIWFDGGVLPPEKGGIDVLPLLRKYQPDAIAFQGPYGYENNIRWVGNENGVAPYPCWSRADSTTSATGLVEIRGLNGNPDGSFWCPGEADFALRRGTKEKPVFQGGWFWRDAEEDRIRTLEDLRNRYLETVGRNTNMLLGIVVDDRGLVPDGDLKRLAEFGEEIKKYFSKPLGTASGNKSTITLNLKQKPKVNYVVLQEDIAKGERVRKYKLLGKENGAWVLLSEGESIGHKRIEVLDNIRLESLKLEVIQSDGTPRIRQIACF